MTVTFLVAASHETSAPTLPLRLWLTPTQILIPALPPAKPALPPLPPLRSRPPALQLPLPLRHFRARPACPHYSVHRIFPTTEPNLLRFQRLLTRRLPPATQAAVPVPPLLNPGYLLTATTLPRAGDRCYFRRTILGSV